MPANAEKNPDYTIVAPANAEKNPDYTTVVPANAGTQRGGEGRSEPVPSTAEGPVLSLSKEQCSGDSAVPGPAANKADLTVVPAEAGSQVGGGAHSPADRVREEIEAHWHEPDSYGATIDSTTPGRSPPR